jgi:cyclopropane-fatty-acyl-phospholipid synthase
MTGCTLDTLTLSSEQASLARSRITAAGLSSSITVHLLDYRNIPAEWDHAFDRVVSIEMIEAVGHEYLETYWGVLHRAMKEKDAVGVVQVITIPEASECPLMTRARARVVDNRRR